MASRLAWRRVITAGGMYGAAVAGFLGTVVAARSLGPPAFGLLAIVLAAQGFFQLFLDLSVGDALVKYGFRYSTAEDWGRLRRLLGVAVRVQAAGAVLAALATLALVPLAGELFGVEGLETPLAVSALLPLISFPVGIATAVMIVRGRYDFHAATGLITMTGRLVAMAVGSQYGVTETVVLLVVAQVVAVAVVATLGWRGFRRFPRRPAEPLAGDVPALRRFVLSSTLATTIGSFRTVFPPLLLGIVSTPSQVAYFRAAQAPEYGFGVLSSPVRIILLTEHTRDVERGEYGRVEAGIRRYMTVAAGLMAVLVPPAIVFMPQLVELVFGPRYAEAADAARLILAAAAIHLVFGWAKSFPVSIGRPHLRVIGLAVELAVVVPALVVLGARWDATGAAGAILLGGIAYAATWTILALRLRAEWRARA